MLLTKMYFQGDEIKQQSHQMFSLADFQNDIVKVTYSICYCVTMLRQLPGLSEPFLSRASFEVVNLSSVLF